ncbi:MAG: DUF6261 family protein [Prevotellaceae bacterium]|jgi:hypothetical protein|nr:DUF6261 family protein [Prevotellaceae bacterium]
MKTFVRPIKLIHLRDGEHLKFFTGLLKMIAGTNNAVKTAVEGLLPEFTGLVHKEKNIIEKILKNELPDLLVKTGKLRDGLYHALWLLADVCTHSLSNEHASCAEALKSVFEKFGDIESLSPCRKTITVDNLLQEAAGYTKFFKLLHLERLLDDLAAANTMHDELYKSQASGCLETSAVPALKDIRMKVDGAYGQLVAALEQAMFTYGISPYSNFIIILNTRIQELKG